MNHRKPKTAKIILGLNLGLRHLESTTSEGAGGKNGRRHPAERGLERNKQGCRVMC